MPEQLWQLPLLNHAISQDSCNSTWIFEKRLYLYELSSCVHVNLHVHVRVFGLFVCVYVSRLKETRIEPKKIECIVCSLCMRRHKISFDGHAQHFFSFALSLHIHSRARSNELSTLDAFVCRSASLAAFYSVAVLQTNSTLSSWAQLHVKILFFQFTSLVHVTITRHLWTCVLVPASSQS